MRELLTLGLLVALVAFVYSRMHVLEEKLTLLKRCVDRQLGESDIEYVIKSVRESTADALEQRLRSLEAQADAHSKRLNDSAACTSTAPEA